MIFFADQQKCPHEYALYLRHRGSYSYPHSGYSSLEKKRNEKTELNVSAFHNAWHNSCFLPPRFHIKHYIIKEGAEILCCKSVKVCPAADDST